MQNRVKLADPLGPSIEDFCRLGDADQIVVHVNGLLDPVDVGKNCAKLPVMDPVTSAPGPVGQVPTGKPVEGSIVVDPMDSPSDQTPPLHPRPSSGESSDVGGAASFSVPITVWHDERDTAPSYESVAWDVLVEALRHDHVRRGPCTLATCAGHACPHKSGLAWSPVRYRDGTTRGIEGIEAIGALVLDLDGLDEDALTATRAALGPYRHVIHSTHSDREGARSLRVVVALSREVTAQEWPRVWSGAVALLGGHADASTKDASRIYFLPSRPEGADYAITEHEGAALDVDAILASAPVETTPPPTTPPTTGAIREGGRNAGLTALAGKMRAAGMSVEAIERALLAENPRRCDPPLDDAEVRTIARSIGRYTPTYDAAGEAGTRANVIAMATGDSVVSHYTPDEAITFLNDRYAWISSLGKVAAIPRTPEDRLEFRKIDGFKTTYNNRTVLVETSDGTKAVPLADYWLRSPGRRTYERVGLWPPPGEAPHNALNLWRGFSVEPRPGDWSRLKTHIDEVIAGGNVKIAEYVVRWIAWMFQNPGERAEAAIVLRGDEGVGKGILGNALRRIMGPHAVHVTSPDHFVGGRFNAHMAEGLYLFADECYWSGDRAHEGKLKGLITEPTILVEPKGVDPYAVDNALHILISSNNQWVVPAGVNARRFVVSDVSPRYRGDRAYFAALMAEINGGGLEAMLHDLQAKALGDWHPRQIVDSDALQDQKERSLDRVSQWILHIVETGVLPGGGRGLFVSTPQIKAHAEETDPKLRDMGVRTLGKALRSIGAVPHKTGKRGWNFPTLIEARQKWAEEYFARSWDDLTAWQ